MIFLKAMTLCSVIVLIKPGTWRTDMSNVIVASVFWIVVVAFLYTRIKNLNRLFASQKARCDEAEESRRRFEALTVEYAAKIEKQRVDIKNLTDLI